MSGFSRINPDVIDLGTTTLSGVSARLHASARAPYDGTFTTTLWADTTPYLAGAAVVYRGNLYNAVSNHVAAIGVNDPESDTYDPQGVGTFWKKVDGKDGDVWVRVSGSQSNVYQKANNKWTSFIPAFSPAIPLNDSATGDLAFSFVAAQFPTAIIDYYIFAPTGELERGEMSIINDGVTAVGSQYNVNQMNGALGVDFSFQISGANVEVTYDSSATPINRNLFYKIRN